MKNRFGILSNLVHLLRGLTNLKTMTEKMIDFAFNLMRLHDRDVAFVIIELVPVATSTNWFSKMFVALKIDGSSRHTVDSKFKRNKFKPIKPRLNLNMFRPYRLMAGKQFWTHEKGNPAFLSRTICHNVYPGMELGQISL